MRKACCVQMHKSCRPRQTPRCPCLEPSTVHRVTPACVLDLQALQRARAQTRSTTMMPCPLSQLQQICTSHLMCKALHLTARAFMISVCFLWGC